MRAAAPRARLAGDERRLRRAHRRRLPLHLLALRALGRLDGRHLVLRPERHPRVLAGRFVHFTHSGSRYVQLLANHGVRSGGSLPHPLSQLLGLPGETLLLSGVTLPEQQARLVRSGVSVVTLPLQAGRLDLAAVLQHLGALELNEVHVEAGATLCGALLQAGLVDELVGVEGRVRRVHKAVVLVEFAHLRLIGCR